MNKRCGIYARVSTSDQSPEMQLLPMREFCKQRQLPLTEYIDAGVSGSKENRPQLDRLMEDARKGRLSMVLVWRFDRFARSTAHLHKALDEFNSLGVPFVSLTEHVDTSTPMGMMVFTILSAVAQMERELIRERVKAGLRNARAKGKRLGRRKGTRVTVKDKPLGRPKGSIKKVDPQLVAQIHALRSRNHTQDVLSYREIAKRLNLGFMTVYNIVNRKG